MTIFSWNTVCGVNMCNSEWLTLLTVYHGIIDPMCSANVTLYWLIVPPVIHVSVWSHTRVDLEIFSLGVRKQLIAVEDSKQLFNHSYIFPVLMSNLHMCDVWITTAHHVQSFYQHLLTAQTHILCSVILRSGLHCGTRYTVGFLLVIWQFCCTHTGFSIACASLVYWWVAINLPALSRRMHTVCILSIMGRCSEKSSCG